MTHQFRVELFTDPTEYEEEPLRDRKSQLPNLTRDNEKAEFVRDVIALANTARMFGFPAYLLYGLRDNVDNGPVICGVGDSLSAYGTPGTHHAWEQFQKQVGQAISNYITPLLNPEFRHSRVGEFEVAYLQIPPLASPTVFQTRKSIKNQFGTGRTWIRFGESKREIKLQDIVPDDDRYRYAYSHVPYVLPRIWKRYFESVLNTHNPVENLIAAQDIRGYQDLYVIDGRFLKDVLVDFLKSDQTLLVIRGVAGSGKSAFLWRWIAAQAEVQLQAVEQKIAREELTLPDIDWIPVYHRLRNEPVRSNYRLEIRLLDAVNKKSKNGFWTGKRRPSQVEELFCKSLNWVICLDGLDEIRTANQQDIFIESLRGFLETYPGVKIILTTRPDTGVDILRAWGGFVTIASFNDTQIEFYLQNMVNSEEYEEFVEFLHSENELWELCRIPAYLEAACQRLPVVHFIPLEPIAESQQEMLLELDHSKDTMQSVSLFTLPRVEDTVLELENPVTDVEEDRSDLIPEGEVSRPLQITEILYEMYDYLWRREGKRRTEFDRNETDWWLTLGKLAIKMDGRQLDILETDARKMLGKTALRHILSLGILKRSARLICFNTELTKAYFAAAWLRDCLESNDILQAQRLLVPVTSEFQQQVHVLLESLTVKDIQSLFQEVSYESV